MSLIHRHLEQISLSADSISSLPFPPPKIFTNALLSTPDITSLIRDTEPHERALFSVPPPAPTPTASTPYPAPSNSKRRQTVFAVAAGEVTHQISGSVNRPRRNTAVAAVLGAELHSEVRKAEGRRDRDGAGGEVRDVDVEVLLRGAEKLNGVYTMPGVEKRIESLRGRYERIRESVGFYEEKVARQTRELERMKRGDGFDEEEEEEFDEEGRRTPGWDEGLEVSEEDLRREEEEIAELERRKRELEDRVSGMERDLGGLLR